MTQQELLNVKPGDKLIIKTTNEQHKRCFGHSRFEGKIITVNNLSKTYGTFEAVKGISFDVLEGEIFGLLGPNGAGKTTTLEIIETLREKSGGEVMIDGLNIDRDQNEIKKIIGVQLQAAGYYPSLNLMELLDLFSGLYNINVDRKEILASVGLEDKAKNKYKELSGGQKQRFSIAAALVHNPKVFFMDEPTTGLDPQARRNLWDLVQDIKKRGITVIMTTHYMEEAELLCDRVAIMDEGEIKVIDTPKNLVKQLLGRGFTKKQIVEQANLEDVFIDLTGKHLRD